MKYDGAAKTGDIDAPGHSKVNIIMVYTIRTIEDLADRMEQTKRWRSVIAPTAWQDESDEACWRLRGPAQLGEPHDRLQHPPKRSLSRAAH
jgi:hypothetical protein